MAEFIGNIVLGIVGTAVFFAFFALVLSLFRATIALLVSFRLLYFLFGMQGFLDTVEPALKSLRWIQIIWFLLFLIILIFFDMRYWPERWRSYWESFKSIICFDF